jgi:transcriptional regulator with XRE-family HTH domain
VAPASREPPLGRFGRQPAHRVLRERGIPQADLVQLTGCSPGQISEVLRGFRLPSPSLIDALSELLGLSAEELFAPAVLEAARPAPDRLGRPPSGRAGPFGRQPAYWALRKRGMRQDDLMVLLGRSRGHISAVLNGFALPDVRFVQKLSETLAIEPSELFAASVLEQVKGR